MDYRFIGTNEVVCAGLNWLPGETKHITDEATLEELDRSPLHERADSSPTSTSGSASLPAVSEVPEANDAQASENDRPDS